MNTRIARFAGLGLAVVAAGALAACSTTNRKGSLEDTTMGEALRQTMAAQVIDPDPRYDTPDPVTSADKAAQAVERYRKGTVKQPERVRSTEGLGDSGSSVRGSGGN